MNYYIRVNEAKARIASLPATLDAETVQKCIEALEVPEDFRINNVENALMTVLGCREDELVFFEQCKCDMSAVVLDIKNQRPGIAVSFADIIGRVNETLHDAAQKALGMKKTALADRLKAAREADGPCNAEERMKCTIELHLLNELSPMEDLNIEKGIDGYAIAVKSGVTSDIYLMHFADELKCIAVAFGLPIRYRSV